MVYALIILTNIIPDLNTTLQRNYQSNEIRIHKILYNLVT